MSAFDCIRFVNNILDAKPKDSKLSDAQFILKVIEVGLRNIRNTEKSFEDGFKIYLESKQHLRPDSIRDIRCIGNRLIRPNPELARRNFSELSAETCDEWINAAFTTAPQQNKARAMLHALFNFALRRDWCENNPIDKIERRRTIEKQIDPLTLAQIRRIRYFPLSRLGVCMSVIVAFSVGHVVRYNFHIPRRTRDFPRIARRFIRAPRVFAEKNT